MVVCFLTCVIPALTLGVAPLGGAGQSEVERTLTKAGVKTDTESLLTFFRQRTLSATDALKLEATVRRLGDDSYEARTQASADLVAAGAVAVRYLQPALKDPDLEVARRAERCLETIQRVSGRALPTAAARL